MSDPIIPRLAPEDTPQQPATSAAASWLSKRAVFLPTTATSLLMAGKISTTEWLIATCLWGVSQTLVDIFGKA